MIRNNVYSKNIAKSQKRLKKVPKGTSEYQAAWIVDDDDNEV
jgi:hypothetical protein